MLVVAENYEQTDRHIPTHGQPSLRACVLKVNNENNNFKIIDKYCQEIEMKCKTDKGSTDSSL